MRKKKELEYVYIFACWHKLLNFLSRSVQYCVAFFLPVVITVVRFHYVSLLFCCCRNGLHVYGKFSIYTVSTACVTYYCSDSIQLIVQFFFRVLSTLLIYFFSCFLLFGKFILYSFCLCFVQTSKCTHTRTHCDHQLRFEDGSNTYQNVNKFFSSSVKSINHPIMQYMLNQTMTETLCILCFIH